MPGLNADLALAVRRMNAIYARIPTDQAPDINGESWCRLEAEIDRASSVGDYEAAIVAIGRWEEHARRVLEPLADQERRP